MTQTVTAAISPAAYVQKGRIDDKKCSFDESINGVGSSSLCCGIFAFLIFYSKSVLMVGLFEWAEEKLKK